jgi:hypothetical protein
MPLKSSGMFGGGRIWAEAIDATNQETTNANRCMQMSSTQRGIAALPTPDRCGVLPERRQP